MKRFLKQVLIVVIGIFTSLVLLGGVVVVLLQPSELKVVDKTVLHIALRGQAVEHNPDTFTQFFQGNQEETIDLVALKSAIKHAQKDKNIAGIYLEADDFRVGWASLEEIREALLSFQEAGKFIVAYAEHYTQKTYYLASIADDIVQHPQGLFPLRGLNQTVFFYKSLLEKLEITPQVFRVGKYKSAIEPFTRQNMSPSSKHQSAALLDVIYSHFLDQVSRARKVKKASLQEMANMLSVVMPQDAYQAKLISHVAHFDDVEALIKTRLALEEEDTISYTSFEEYAAHKKSDTSSENQVAVIVAEGAIVDGKGAPGCIGSQDLAATLKKVREDEAIKAVVLRINSPGGSALASEVLWKEIILTKAKKPVVASMSDVAASGGYYLASACSRILAHPTTVTGSIGIFALFFDVNALLRNKLGITTDVVKTSSSADMFINPGRPLTAHEKSVIQKCIDKGYDTFLERVAQGRGLDKAAIARVASGRVWAGRAAQKQKLVDKLGGLEEAIQAAAELAALDKENYGVSYWPKSQTLYEKILNIWGSSLDNKVTFKTLQSEFPVLGHIEELTNMTGIQARLPYKIEIE